MKDCRLLPHLRRRNSVLDYSHLTPPPSPLPPPTSHLPPPTSHLPPPPSPLPPPTSPLPPPPSHQLRVKLTDLQSSVASAVDSKKLKQLQSLLDARTETVSSLNKTVQSLKQVRPVSLVSQVVGFFIRVVCELSHCFSTSF